MIRSLRPWLAQLYPRAWRIRYEEEFTAMLEQCLNSPLDVLDILLGAVDAHLLLLSGESLNWRVINMLNKIRTAVLIVFTAYIGFVIAGFALVGMADDSPMIALTKTNTVLTAAWTTIQVGAAVALLAVVIGGMPLAITIIRRLLSDSHRGMGLLLVPVIAFLALVIYVAFIFAVGSGRIQVPGVVPVVQPGVFPPGNRLLMAGLMVIFVLGALASTLVVWKLVSRTDIEQEEFRAIKHSVAIKIYDFAFWPAVVTTSAMAIMLVATLTWGSLSFSSLPGVFAGNFGPWGTSTQVWFISLVLLMALSTAAAFLGLMRARPTARAFPSQ